MFISDQTCNFFKFLSFSEEFDIAETITNKHFRSRKRGMLAGEYTRFSADLFYSFCGC